MLLPQRDGSAWRYCLLAFCDRKRYTIVFSEILLLAVHSSWLVSFRISLAAIHIKGIWLQGFCCKLVGASELSSQLTAQAQP